MKKTMTALVVCLALCLGSLVQASAMSVKDLTYITEQYPPYNFKDQGELKGIAVDVLEAMFDEMNVGLGKGDIKLLPWAKGYDLAQNDPGTVLFSTTRSEARENMFKWVGPIAPTKISLVARKDSNVSISSIDDVKQYTVGVIRDDIGQQLLEEAGVSTSSLDIVSRADSNIKKLSRGRVDAWAYEETVAMWLIKSEGLDPADFEPVHTLSESQLFFAFHMATPDALIEEFQQALDAVKDSGQYQQVMDTYLK